MASLLTNKDSEISKILLTIPHVVSYDFIESKGWVCFHFNQKKKGIEGTLFVYERNREFGFIILNRISLNNLQMDITGMDIQMVGEYIMYKLPNGSPHSDVVHGLWIFGQEYKQQLFHELQSCVSQRLAINVSFILNRMHLHKLKMFYWGAQLNLLIRLPKDFLIVNTLLMKLQERLEAKSKKRLWKA